MSAEPIRAVATVSPRSAATRAKLIAVAERLFADQGIAGVSLNEINRAAQQRHSNACHYHFGSKDGLIQAILDKHVPGIAAERHAMFDAMEAAGEAVLLRDVVHAFVKPVAAKLLDPNGGKEFIRLNAQLVVTHTMAAQNKAPSPFIARDTDRLNRKLKAALAEQRLAEPVRRQRLMMAAIMLFHGLADHSRLLEAFGTLNADAVGAFARDLEVMIAASLSAPASDAKTKKVQGRKLGAVPA